MGVEYSQLWLLSFVLYVLVFVIVVKVILLFAFHIPYPVQGKFDCLVVWCSLL